MTSKGQTAQNRILEFIKEFINDNGYPPTVREIAKAVGIQSTSTIHDHLKRLEQEGFLHRDGNKPRAIELNHHKVSQATISIPILGHVAAGLPILAEENFDSTLEIPRSLLGDGYFFILQVHGDSMIEAGILDRDYVMVRQQTEAYNGDIVVAMIQDEATIKRFFREKGYYRLQPENHAMQQIITDQLTILGKVVAVYRTIK